MSNGKLQMASITINEVAEHIKLDIAAGVVPVLVGIDGIGKTYVIRQITYDICEGRMVGIRVSEYDVAELGGFPHGAETHGGRMSYDLPAWWPPQEWIDQDLPFAIVLDEINRPADVGTFQCLHKFLSDRQVHETLLPSNAFIIAAMNPDDGNYQVETLDQALTTKMAFYEVTTSASIWCRWAKKNKIHPMIVNFIAERGDSELIKGNRNRPRTWHYFSDQLSVLEKHQREDLIFTKACSTLMADTAMMFSQYYEDNAAKPIDTEKLLKYTKKMREQVLRFVEKDKIDVIRATCDLLLARETSPTKQQAKKLCQFFLDIPWEIAQNTMLSMQQREEPWENVLSVAAENDEIMKLAKETYEIMRDMGENDEKES